MGQYWTLSIKRYDVLEGKNYFDGSMLQLFRQEDAKIERVNSGRAGYYEYKTYEYTSRVCEMRERLDLMGFSIDRAAEDFERGRQSELEQVRQSELEDYDELASAYVRFLSEYSFSKWLSVMRPLIRSGEHQYVEIYDPLVGSAEEFICSYNNGNTLHGFFNSDSRFVLRGCLEAAAPQARVRLNLADLINGGYFDENTKVTDFFTEAAIEYSRTSPVIILTEGSSDRQILEGTLPLVYPHLSGFFSFMDFKSSNASGGTGQLVATIKAFIGSGIKNRILAVFDNDTAAQVALRGLEKVTIPPNIKCCKLPNLRLARKYPSIGPHGQQIGDINGKACSIEMFFGSDILGRGKLRTPVRWGAYDNAVRQYQGQIEKKKVLQKKFFTKLQSATRSQVKNNLAWSDIRDLWAYLKNQSQTISLDMVHATERARSHE